MRIDAHQHLWFYNSSSEYAWIDESMSVLRRNFGPADLKTELDAAGFAGSVLVQVRQTLEETRWMLNLAADCPFILGVVGWVDLRSTDVARQLESFAADAKLMGVRHIVQAEPNDHFLLQPEFLRGISLLKEFDLAYNLLIYHHHLPVAIDFVRKFPQQRIILDHMAKPLIKDQILHPWVEHIRELAKFPNVYCKISGLVTEADWHSWRPENLRPYIDVAFECFGPDRLMVGSDWPVCTLAAPYSRAVSVVTSYLDAFSPDVREKVLGANAQEFYRLKTLPP